MISVDRPPLPTLPTNRNADSFSKLLPSVYRFFWIIHVTDYILTVDEDGISFIIWIDHAIQDVKTNEHPRRFKTPKNVLNVRQTFHETDPYGDNGTTLAEQGCSYTESGPPISTHTNTTTSSENTTDLKQTVYGNWKISLEENYDSWDEKAFSSTTPQTYTKDSYLKYVI